MAAARARTAIDRNRSHSTSRLAPPLLKRKNWNRRTVALTVAATAAISTFSNCHDAFGATRTFTNATAGASWAVSANWTGGIPAAGDTAEILDGGNLFLTGTQSIQTLRYTGASPRSVGDTSTAASTLQFNGNGTAPLINVLGAGNLTLSSNVNAGTGAMGVILNSSGDFNVVSSGTTLTVGSDISESNGSRGITINANGGAGTVILAENSSFTGGITIAGGVLQLNTALSTNATVPNKISFSSAGKLELNNGPTIGGLSSTASAPIVEATGTNTLFISQDDIETYSGVLQNGSGVLGISKSGAGTLILNGGGNSFTGQVSIVGGTLMADHSSVPTPKLGNGSNPLVMQGGVLLLKGDSDSPLPADSESFATTGLNGSQSVFQIVTGSNGTSINVGALTHAVTATADFRVSGFGAAQFTTTTANDSTGNLGPWALYQGNDWATNDGAGHIVPFTGYAPKDDPSTWASGDQVTYGGSVGHVGASTAITSLRFDSLTTLPVLNIDANQTLTVSNGGVLTTFHALLATINGPGTLTSGTNTLFFHANGGGVAVNAPIANGTAGALTVVQSGPAFYQPTATNTYTGDTVVNAGSLLLNMDTTTATLTNKGVAGALGAGNNIALSGGTLTVISSFAGPQATNRDIQLSGVTGIDASNQLTLSGVISDPLIKGTLNLDGSGNVTLTNSGNSYRGGTHINGGSLTLTTADALGNAAGAVLLNGGTLNIAGTMSFIGGRTLVSRLATLPVNVTGTNTGTLGPGGSGGGILVPGGTFLKSGSGTLAIGLNFTNTASKVLITGGNLAIAAETQLGAVPSTLVPDAVELNGGTLRFFSSGSQGFSLNSNRGVQVDAGGGGTLDFSYTSGTGIIANPISGAGRLYKNGPVTVSSNVSHSFSGGLDILEGRWNVTAAGAASTGSIIMEAGSPNASPRDGGNVVSAIAQLGIGSTSLNLTLPLSNNILLSPVGSGVNGFEINTGDNLVLNGVISGTGGFTKGAVAATTGTLTLGGSNSYSGTTNILLGTLSLGANDVIPDGSQVSLASAASMFVKGNSDTIGSLTGAGTVDLGTGGALSAGGDNASASFSGAIQGSGSVTKVGTGTQTFSGTNTYTGLTTVTAGNLTLTGSPAQSRVLTGGGGDIQGGRLVFSDDSSAATIKSLLKTSYQNNGFNNTSQIRSTTADALHGLGFVDNGTTFTVGYTYYGDTNLDGQVTTGDFTALAQHFNQATTNWSDGDFNYDGVVNLLDFNAIATNFGATPALTAPPALGTLVPEPVMLGSLSLALTLLARRNRRR